MLCSLPCISGGAGFLVKTDKLLCMFPLQELGTSGNLDGQQRLIVKGRFLPKGFENVIRRYMNEYVLCASCKSPDTLLDRDAGDHPLPMCIAALLHCETLAHHSTACSCQNLSCATPGGMHMIQPHSADSKSS